MPLLRMNAPCGVDNSVFDFPEIAARKLLAEAPNTPVTILIHGYRYSPFGRKNNPHDLIFSRRPNKNRRNCKSWPNHLGFGGKQSGEGLCFAFAWHASGSIWQAYRQAFFAAQTLAAIINKLREIAPDRRINVIAHSLGARVLLSSLAYLPKDALHRVVLMAGAELSAKAQSAIQSPCGQSCEFLNITSRENDFYDLLIETAIAPHRPFARSLGQGLMRPCKNWLDMQLDCNETLQSLRKRGFPISPPNRRVCHWSSYLRPGMFPLYRRFLNKPEALPLAELARACPPKQSRRWSRLLTIRPLLSGPAK